MDKVGGILEVGRTKDTHEIVIRHLALNPDANGLGQIVFSPRHARHLANVLIDHATYLNSGVIGRLLEGLGVSGLHSYESGPPIHITSSAPGLPLFNANLFVNIVPGVKQKLASRGNVVKYNALYDANGTAHGTKWLNADAFANPDSYSFGNSRYYLDHLQQLAILNENLSFYKRTSFGKGRYAELRSEMFNAFNRANYSGLDTNLADNTPNGHFGEYTSEYSNAVFGVQPGPRITELVLKIVF